MSAALAGEVLYEVDLDLELAVADEYREWLADHIDEILALPGFIGATVLEVSDPPPAPGRARMAVQYRLRDPAALERYLRDHAPRLRAEGLARFGGRFSASRRVLRVLEPRCRRHPST